MGRIKSYIHAWLEDYGYSLGFDTNNIPNLEDLNWVANDSVEAEAYWTKENKNDNPKIFIKWLILLPIITNNKDKKIPIEKTSVMFKFVKLKPCNVDIIFQIDKIHVRKKDDITKNIIKDLIFICFFSN